MHFPEKTTLLLHATCTSALSTLLPRLRLATTASNVFLVAVEEVSSQSANLEIEFHHHAVQDLYTCLVRCGLHLSRSTHIALASLCPNDRAWTGGPLHGRLEIRSVSLASLHRLHGAFPLSA